MPVFIWLRLEVIGLAATSLAALIRTNAEGLLPLDLHTLIEQQFHGLSHAVKALLGERLDRS